MVPDFVNQKIAEFYGPDKDLVEHWQRLFRAAYQIPPPDTNKNLTGGWSLRGGSITLTFVTLDMARELERRRSFTDQSANKIGAQLRRRLELGSNDK